MTIVKNGMTCKLPEYHRQHPALDLPPPIVDSAVSAVGLLRVEGGVSLPDDYGARLANGLTTFLPRPLGDDIGMAISPSLDSGKHI